MIVAQFYKNKLDNMIGQWMAEWFKQKKRVSEFERFRAKLIQHETLSSCDY